jgi:heptosyltransferase-2
VARCSRAQFIIGPHRPNEAEPVHAAQVFLKPLEQLAIFDADSLPRLRLAAFRHSGATFLALHPGSGSERKNWPEAEWAELVQHLINETDLNLLLVGGEAEGERLQRLAAALPPARARVAQNLPLQKLAGVLQGCRGFVGHDSGISHLAAALGVPGIVLWGDSAEQIWRPPHENVTVLNGRNGIGSITVRDVVRELAELAPAF